ncbi:MAG: hypothetical protein QOJ27_467 [Sphingomonadales bacterium]|nr:hypothetical protein [Sphingomonadales bacterium]
MKTLLFSMAAIGALAAAAPAAAQYGYGSNVNAGGAVGISNRVAQLDARLNAGIQAGVINPTEARSLRMQMRQLQRLERQYSYNGLTMAERQDLQMRLRNLRQDLRMADNGRFDRDNRYGSVNDPYYNDGAYTGQGGPYEQPYDTYCDTNNRGLIGGVVDSVLGRNDNCSGVRVGSRATGNLYSVPSQYRYQYRDGNGVYYRSDGRAIYQIDARTDTVLRVYSMDR